MSEPVAGTAANEPRADAWAEWAEMKAALQRQADEVAAQLSLLRAEREWDCTRRPHWESPPELLAARQGVLEARQGVLTARQKLIKAQTGGIRLLCWAAGVLLAAPLVIFLLTIAAFTIGNTRPH